MEKDRYVPEYRVIEADGGYEAQMKYLVCGGEQWYALLANGYLADPDIWSAGRTGSAGKSDVRSILPTRGEAEAAMNKAMRINEQWNLKVVSAHQLHDDVP